MRAVLVTFEVTTRVIVPSDTFKTPTDDIDIEDIAIQRVLENPSGYLCHETITQVIDDTERPFGTLDEDYTHVTGRLFEVIDVPKCKELIAKCPLDEVVILVPHFSINVQSHYEDGEQLQWDLDELESYIGHTVEVNDYDDLICDPHGIIKE